MARHMDVDGVVRISIYTFWSCRRLQAVVCNLNMSFKLNASMGEKKTAGTSCAGGTSNTV